jgi:hypothetical protein
MSPSSVLREIRDGQSAAARTGLLWLGIGALAILFAMVLMAPSMGGLSMLPGHVLDKPAERAPAHARPRGYVQPKLTPRQEVAVRRSAVKMALSQVGVHERGNNGGRRLLMYRRAVTGRGENPHAREPWCADFVSWAWRRGGVRLGFDGKGSDYVPELVVWASLTRRWHRARDGYRPRQGDLIVYRTGEGGRYGHIGMVVKTTPGRVHTVEGNYADRVMRRTIKPWGPSVTGFISPV